MSQELFGGRKKNQQICGKKRYDWKTARDYLKKEGGWILKLKQIYTPEN